MLKRLSGKNEYFFLVHVNHISGLQSEILDGTDQIKIAWARGEDKTKSGSTEPITLQRASSTTAIGKLITSGGKFDRSVKSQSGFKSKSFALKLLEKDQEFWSQELDMAEFLVSGQRNEVKKEINLSTWGKHPNAKLVIDIRTGPEGDSSQSEPFKVELPTYETGRTRTLARGRVVQRASVYNSLVQSGSMGGNAVQKSENGPTTNTELLQKQNEMLKEQVQSQRAELVSLRTEIDSLKQQRTQNGEDLILRLQKEIDELNEKLLQASGYESDGYGDERVAELETELREKDAEIQRLSLNNNLTEMKKLQADKDKLQLANETIQRELTKLKEEVNLKSEFKASNLTVDSLSIEIKQLKTRVNTLEQERDLIQTEAIKSQSELEKKLRMQKETFEEDSKARLEEAEKKHKIAIDKMERRIMIERSNLELQLNTAIQAKQRLEDEVSSLKEVIRAHTQKENEYEQQLSSSLKQIELAHTTEKENKNTISKLNESIDTLNDKLKSSQQQHGLLETETRELRQLLETKNSQIIDLQMKNANTSSNNNKEGGDLLKENLQKLKELEQTIQSQKTEILRLQRQNDLQEEQLAEKQENIASLKQKLLDQENRLRVSEALVHDLQSNNDQWKERSSSNDSHITSLQKEVKELRESMRKKELEVNQTSQQIQALASKLEKSEQDKKQLEEKKKNLEVKLKESKEEIDSIDLSKGNTDAHLLNKLKKVETERDSLILECEQQSLTAKQKNEELERLQLEKTQLELRIAEAAKTIKTLKQENTDYLQLSSRKSESGVDPELINKLQTKVDRIEAEKEELFQQVENQTKEVIALRQQLKSATTTIVKLKHQLSTLSSTDQHVASQNDETENQLRLTKEENMELKEKLVQLREQLVLSKEKLSMVKKKVRHMEREKKDQESQKLIIELSHKENIARDQESLSKEMMILDPIGSVKHSALIIVTYYESKIEEFDGNLSNICSGSPNKKLVRLVNTLLCESLVYVFKSGFTPPFWFFTTPHYWHMIEEVSALYHLPNNENDTPELLLGSQFASYVQLINREISCGSGTYTIEDLKFRAFMIHCVNQQNLHKMIQFLFTHRSILSRYYSPDDAVIMDSGCQRKLVGFLTLLCKLPFSIPLSSVATLHDDWVEEISC